MTMSPFYTFDCPCGHNGTVKPVVKVGGMMQGKWCCRITGPKVTGESGIKTVYSDPNVDDAKMKIARFLGIQPYLVMLTEVEEEPFVTGPSSPSTPSLIDEYDLHLRSALKKLRLRLAREKDLPAYCIFDDKTLNSIVASKPNNLTELVQVKGIKDIKAEQYGADILDVVRTHHSTQR